MATSIGTTGITFPDATVQTTASVGGFGGATTNAVSSSAITLTNTSSQYQVAQISSYANSYVTLPNATTMGSAGSNPFVIENRSPYGANLEIRNASGTTVGYIPIGQIGLIQLKDKSTSAGQWVVETANPQVFFNYDANSVVSATNSPVSDSYYNFGIVGLTSTTFVRWWQYTVYSGANYYVYVYTQVGTISGSTITLGSIQNGLQASYSFGPTNYSSAGIMRAIRLSNTAFVLLSGLFSIQHADCVGDRYQGTFVTSTNTVSGTTVTFGSPTTVLSYNSGIVVYPNTSAYNAAQATYLQGTACRISDTAYALFYNSSYSGSYTPPYNYAGSMTCQVVTVSGTSQSFGSAATLGTSTYTQAISCVALSSSLVLLAYAQGSSAGASTGRTKLNAVSISGSTATFNTSVTVESIDVSCFSTNVFTDGAVAPSATQFIFNGGYFVGEGTVSGTTVTYDSSPYAASQVVPIYLCTSSKAWGGGLYGTGSKFYFTIGTGGFVTNTNSVDILQTNASITSARPMSPLGAQPTTAFVAYKFNTYATQSSQPVILGTTT